MRIDIMTDIETLGTNADSTIIQVSAIAFDIHTGEHLSTFNEVCDIEKNKRPVRITGGTLKWWLGENKELLTDLLTVRGTHSSEDVLAHFHEWLLGLSEDPKDLHLWGNGILFDNKMIQHQLEAIGLSYPIFYRNDRDMRTIVDLASQKLGVTEKELKARFEDDSLVAHDAFDDVVYQIRLVTKCFETLTKEGGEGA